MDKLLIARRQDLFFRAGGKVFSEQVRQRTRAVAGKEDGTPIVDPDRVHFAAAVRSELLFVSRRTRSSRQMS